MSEKFIPSVLIIDDDPKQIVIASSILKSENCSVLAATKCSEAFEVIKREMPSLIVLDIVMPDMNGFEFCKKIKSDPKTADIPVIFATAYNDSENIRKSFEAGGNDYVVKPFIKDELLQRVKIRIKLSRQNQKLKRSYEELDKFCYMVAHDIRSPLYVIAQLIDIMKVQLKNGSVDEVEKICTMITEKSDKVVEMANSLLKFSKATQESSEKSAVDLNVITEELFEDFKFIEKDRTIVFEKDDLPVVSGDKNLFKTVLQNIIGNAVKFTRTREKAEITVKSYKNKDEYEISVSDNGIGFDMKYAKDVFDVFQRIPDTAVQFEGNGIGLSVVRKIIRRYGGDVSIYSVPDFGTTVTFTLPIPDNI